MSLAPNPAKKKAGPHKAEKQKNRELSKVRGF
jgi:hypothetical protein